MTQALLLADTLKVEALFNLRCTDRTELATRLRKRAVRENRLDDASQEVIRHRLEVYESTSESLLDFYGPELVHNVDSQQLPVKVLYEIINRIRNMN